jgi:hypothetical protein
MISFAEHAASLNAFRAYGGDGLQRFAPALGHVVFLFGGGAASREKKDGRDAQEHGQTPPYISTTAVQLRHPPRPNVRTLGPLTVLNPRAAPFVGRTIRSKNADTKPERPPIDRPGAFKPNTGRLKFIFRPKGLKNFFAC